eukprot:CAMPEP_0180649992 /NCGR_PEP_ID=MMETSP1037_2-20121125/51942_1 /TAXON_ID=632150 /ORGANISM="Azadinium spinosum, Strain 3D9" /LENGTH=56 /DNA_ID=CAMNT_0022675201 /DNA_START=97 /DNA_END=264 /DNA_ORIENTATION=-
MPVLPHRAPALRRVHFSSRPPRWSIAKRLSQSSTCVQHRTAAASSTDGSTMVTASA